MSELNNLLNQIKQDKDTNLLPENLKEGVTVLGIQGTIKNNGELVYTPTKTQQVIPAGYTSGGYISPVTNTIDSNIQAENIKKDVEILNVIGTLESLDTSDANAQPINIRNGKTAYVNGQKLTGTLPVLTYPVNPDNPSDFNYQFIEASSASRVKRDNTYYILGAYQVAAENQPDSWMFEGNRKMKLGIAQSKVASAISLTANKIKKGENVLGIIGTYEPNLQSKSITKTSNGTLNITPDTGYDGLNNVQVIVNVPQESQGFSPDWTELGYNETPQGLIDQFNISKSILENWNPRKTDLTNEFYSNYQDVIFCPLIDTSNATTMQNMFLQCSIVELPKLNTSNVTNFDSFCKESESLSKVNQIDISKATSLYSMFEGCSSLTSFPDGLRGTDVVNAGYMFTQCFKLSDESLNNILKMCTTFTSPDYNAANKTLKYIGISHTKYYPQSRIESLPNYQDFIDAGWTTGY